MIESSLNQQPDQGGFVANKSGKDFEQCIQLILEQQGYQYIEARYFFPACILRQSIYTKQLCIGQTIYQTNRICDFILYHPLLYPQCLVIEAKWQQSSGSVDEKFPYLIYNIEKLNYPTIIIVDGDGAKLGAIEWLKLQVHNLLIDVLDLSQFRKFASKGNL